MLDHVGFAGSDYSRSKTFCKKALKPFGMSLVVEPVGEAAGFGHGVEPSFWIEGQGTPVRGRLHIALAADSREQVDAFRAAAVKAGAGVAPTKHQFTPALSAVAMSSFTDGRLKV